MDTDDFDASMDFGVMENINFDDVDADLANFHKDEIVKEALARGVDLGVYSKQIARDLELAEAKTIQDYVSQADNLAELHYELSKCDSMLERMEATLSTFQHDLNEISSDIESLQTQSVTIALELRNTSAAEKSLSQFLKHAYIAPDLINIILRDPFSDKLKLSGQESSALVADLAKALEALSRKIYVQQLPSVKNTKAAQETEVLLEQLFHRSVATAQQGLTTKISALRKPNVNIQMKQQMMLRLRPLYVFLLLHCSLHNPYEVADVAAEIRAIYSDTLSSVYYHLFKNYMTTTRAVQQESHSSQHDLLGSETRSRSGGFFGFGGGSNSNASRAGSSDHLIRLFSIGQRELTLTSIAKDAIILHIASQTNLSYSYERLFKSSLQLLVDTATAEAEFLWTFFGPGYNGPKASPFTAPSTDVGAVTTVTAAPGTPGNPLETKKSSNSTSPSIPQTLTDVAVAAVNGSATATASGKQSKNVNPFESSAPGLDDDESSDSDDEENDENPNRDDDFIIPISEALGLVSLSASLSPSSRAAAASNAAAALSASRSSVSVKSLLKTVRAIEKQQARSLRSVSGQQAHALLSGVFTRTLAVFTADLDAFLASTHDSIGVLIILRMVYSANEELAARRLPHLNGLLDKLSNSLWVRFKALFAANLSSLEHFSVNSVKKGDTGIHFITLRYAEYCAALHRLNWAYGDEFIETSLASMRLEMEVLLARLSSRVAGSSGDAGMMDSLTLRDKKNKLAFLVNNLVALCRTLRSKGVVKTPEFARFSELLAQSSGSYVEEELAEHFSGILRFVKETEGRIAGMSLPEVQARFVSSFEPKGLQQIIKQFNASWKDSMKAVAANVNKFFICQNEITLSSAPVLSAAPHPSLAAAGRTSVINAGINAKSLANANQSSIRAPTEEEEDEDEEDDDDEEDEEEDDTAPEDLLLETVSPLLQDLSGEILKKTLLQLVFYYRRFQDLLEKMYPVPSAQPSFVREVIPIQNIVYEIKKYGARS